MRKYYGVTETINGNNYTVEIWDEPTGLATTGDQLDMGYPGFTLDYDGEGDKLWENPIKGSKVKAKFIVSDTDDHTFFQNLAVEDEGTAALVIYKNTELFYIGRIISDQMQYERRPEKNTVYTITATDGLSLLNRYKVEYSWFDSTTERLDILNLIRYSLAKTTIPDYYDHLGYEDNYLVDASIDFPTGDFDRLNVFEINLSSVINDFTSFMEQETLYTDEDLFVDCQTAIERVLRMLYSRIIYTNSRFYIYDPIDYAEKAQSISVEYGTDGTQTGKISTLPQYTVGDGSRPCFAAFPIYTHQPAIREIKQNFTRQAINRLIRPFSAFSTNSMQLTTPSIGYVASEERDLNVKAIINFISASFSGTTPPNQLFHEINFRIYVSDNFGYKHYDYQNQTWTSTQSSLPFFERIRCEVTDYEVINSKYAKFKLDFARTFNPPAASDDVVVEISMGKLTWSWGTTRNAVAMWGALYMYEKDSASMSVVTSNDKNLNATENEEFETIYGYEFTGNTLKGIGTIWNSDTSNPSGITASDWSVRQGACYVDAPKTASAQLVDDGDYYPLLTPQFDSESYTFNGGTFNAQDETWDFELIQLAQDVANISSDELDFQDTTNGDDKRNAAVRRLIDQTNVLRDSVSSFDTSLPTDIIRLSDESHTTTPTYDTLFTPYVKYDLSEETLVWLAREEGKSKTITSSETFDDTVSFYKIDTGLNTVQLTLPLPSTVKGKEFTFKKTSPANTVELAGTIDGGTGYFMDYNNETVVLVSDGSEYVIKAEFGKDDLTDVTDRDNTTDNTVGVGALQLNLTPTATPTEGMLYWDEDEETAAVQVNGMNYEIGQGLYWVAKNQTGSTISKGTAVYASGTLGSSGRLLISPMIADGTIEAKYFLGITAEDIINGDDGKVITQGKLRQLDTSAYTAGSVLWVSASTAGDLTSTQPTGTNDIALAVAFVVDASTNGMIAVRVSNIDENDITDVPTLDEVTTEGNTTTNDIEVGGLNVDSGTLYVDSTNNRVGIGTTSPARNLHIHQDDSTLSYIQITNSTTGTSGSDGVSFGITSDEVAIWNNRENTATAISTNNAERMRITSGGNVLIGTTTDSGYKLQVSGDVEVSDSQADVLIKSTTAGQASRLVLNTTTREWRIGTHSGQNNSLWIYDATAASYRLALDTSGNLGVGTTSPSHKLHVNGGNIFGSSNVLASNNVYAAGPQGFVFGSSTSEGEYIYRSGNDIIMRAGSSDVLTVDGDNSRVGIGTTSPSSLLQVQSGVGNTQLDGHQILLSRAGNNHIFATSASGVLALGTNNAEKMRITSSGNVGIGTTNPTSKTHVYYGGGTTNGLHVQASANRGKIAVSDNDTAAYMIAENSLASFGRQDALSANNLNITSGGNVLIGTTTDNGYKLAVSGGDAQINGVNVGKGGGSVAQNTILGYGALTSTTTGNYNTALGYQAGYGNTTGERNTAVGRQALRANSTGSYNVALGMDALNNNTASNNTALGYQAAYSNTSGNIVAIGWQAGFANTTGTITAVGYQALKANTTGGENVAVGRESMRLATASNNTAVGTYSGYVLTTGSGNTIVGRRALFSATTAGYNVAIGAQALYSNVSNNSNVAIGEASLYNNTQNYNTAVGNNAARNNTTGSIVAVGYQAGYSNTTSVGVTAIGHEALRNGITSLSTAVGHQAALSTTTGKVTALGYYAAGTNTTSSEVTAIGQEALRNSTGGANTAIGYQAAYNTTSSTSNTAIGRTTLLNNTTGSNNTAVGRDALRSNTTSSNNTAVGRDAGYNNTTGANNIFIGYGSDGVSATDSNRTFIGNSSTTSTWVGGNLLLGTTTDNTQKLQVNGTSRFDDTMYVSEYIAHLGDGNTAVRFLDDSLQFNAGGVAMMKLTEGSADTVTINPDSADVNFQVNGDTVANLLFVDGGTSKVGIGTSSPAYRLDIKGTSNNIGDGNQIFSVGNTSGGTQLAIGSSEDSYTWIRSYESGVGGRDLALVTNGEAVRIKSGGNVLIGTTTDSGYKLDVSGKIAMLSDGTLLWGSAFDFGKLTYDTGKAIVRGASGKALSLGANNTQDTIYINTSQNVGIGTTSPTRALSVEGTAFVRDDFAITVTNPATNLTKDSQIYLQSKGNQSGTTRSSQWYLQTDSDSIYGNSAFRIAKNYDGGSTVEMMRITSGGNVGIGTSSPSAKLDIVGDGADFFLQSNDFKIARIQPRGTGANLDKGLFSLFDGSTEDVRIDTAGSSWFNGGNVGIGTSSPSAALHVYDISSGEVKFQRATGYTGLLHFGFPSGLPSIRTSGGFAIKASDSWGSDFYINSSGNVGIGTSIPTDKLTVNGNIGLGGNKIYNGSASNSAGIDFSDAQVDLHGYYGIRFFASTAGIGSMTERMRIVNNGNVLIGTTTDSGYKLNVNGTAYASEFDLPSGGQLDWANGDARIKEGDVSNYSLSFQTYTGSALTTKMFINSGGNIGVGTTSPYGKLNVIPSSNPTTATDANQITVGESSSNSQYNLRIGYFLSGGAYKGSIQAISGNTPNTLVLNGDGGSVGIGTYSPSEKLEVAGNIGIDGYIHHNGDDSKIGFEGNDAIRIYTANSVAMQIDSSQRVGIGTTSPSQKLHVVGNVRIDDGYTLGWGADTTKIAGNSSANTLAFKTSSANRLYINSSGNVGINTTSPSSKLHVVGDFFLKGSDTSSSTKNFQVQTGNGTSIMDFRNDAYAFFGCGQGGGSASGFIFRYNSTFGVQFTGYNYGNGTSPSYKPILMDTDLAGRSQGVYVNYGITGYTAPAPTTTAEFAVRGRGTSSSFTAKFEDSATNPLLYIKDNGNVMIGTGTDSGYKLDVEGNTNTNGDYYVNGNQGWSGTININTNPPVAITVEGGIITNVT